MLISTFHDIGPITLPPWRGRQKYMVTINPDDPVMPVGLEDYEPILKDLCGRAAVARIAHVTVDESTVEPNRSQRRPGAHLDGRFEREAKPVVTVRDTGSNGGAWVHAPHQRGSAAVGGWAHYCNRVPVDRMAVVVAASVAGCRVYEGRYSAEPAADGDMEHIRAQLPAGVLLPAGRAFVLSPDCIHESVIFTEETRRTFLRVAFDPGLPDSAWDGLLIRNRQKHT